MKRLMNPALLASLMGIADGPNMYRAGYGPYSKPGFYPPRTRSQKHKRKLRRQTGNY